MPRATEDLLPLVYSELRKLAARKLAREKPGQTLEPTALVHEAYLRLVDAERIPTGGIVGATSSPPPRRRCGAFLSTWLAASAASAMAAVGRGVQLLVGDLATGPVSEDLLDLDEALSRLSAIDERAAELVKLRVFAGMTVDEVAAYQGVSPRTAKRAWAYARAWLMREMTPRPDPGQG